MTKFMAISQPYLAIGVVGSNFCITSEVKKIERNDILQ